MDKYWVIGALIALLGGANSVVASGVVADDGSTKCTNYSSMAIDAAGKVTIAGCSNGSINASFAVTAAATATLTGTPLALTVTRTVNTGGLPGNDTLNLTSSIAGIFTPATLSFTSVDVSPKSLSSSITFSAAGSATLSAAIGSTTVASSSPITVNSGGQCPNNASFIDLGTLPQGTGRTFLVSTAGQFLKFKVPTNLLSGQGYSFTYETAVNGNFGDKEAAISTCAGDFTSIGMTGACHVSASAWTAGAIANSVTGVCVGIPGNTYYLNIKPASGVSEGFVLIVNSF